MGDIVRCGDDHREIVRWLWTILLADGIRAVVRLRRIGMFLVHQATTVTG